MPLTTGNDFPHEQETRARRMAQRRSRSPAGRGTWGKSRRFSRKFCHRLTRTGGRGLGRKRARAKERGRTKERAEEEESTDRKRAKAEDDGGGGGDGGKF